MKRIISVVLALVLSVLCSACSGGNADDVYLTVNNKKVAMNYALKINDREISLAEYRYFYLSAVKSLTDMYSGYTSDWKTNEDLLKLLNSEVVYTVQTFYAVFDLAKELNIELSAENAASIETNIRQKKNSSGVNSFNETLASSYMNEDIYRTTMENYYLKLQIKDYLFTSGGHDASTESIKKDYTENYYRVTYLYIGADAAGEDDNKTLAYTLYDRITKNGEDIIPIIKAYGDDDSLKDPANGHCFKIGQINIDGFEKTALALAENELSSVLESDEGFYVIKKLAIDDAYINANITELTDSYKVSVLTNLTNTTVSKHRLTYSEKFSQITPNTLT